MKKTNILIGLLFLIGVSAQAQSLEEIQQIALDNNPGIQASYKQFEASMEQIPQAKSLEDPVLSAGYFLQPMGTLMGEQVFKLSLNQQFPWFGTLKAKGNAVALQTEANYQNFLNKKAELEQKVAEAFFPLVEVEVFLSIEEEHLQLLKSIYEVAENQYENNEIKLKDLFEIEMQIEEIKTNAKLLLNQKKAYLAQMNALLNRDSSTAIEVIPESEITPLPSSAASVEGHPLLQSLQLQQESYVAQEKFAKKSAMPKIGIGIEYMYLDDFSMNGMQYEGMNMFMPMLSVSLPVFNKKYKSARKEAQFLQEATALEQQAQKNQFTAAVQQNLAAIESQQERLDLLDYKVQKTQQIFDLSFKEFENSLLSLTQLLNVQQRLLDFQQEKQVAKTALQMAQSQLNYLTYKNIE